MAVSKVMTTLAQDAYDAQQYRGVIGASTQSRQKAKAESAEASTLLIDLIDKVAAYVDGAHHAEHYNEMVDALEKVRAVQS